MKKLLTLLLASLMLLSVFFACSKGGNGGETATEGAPGGTTEAPGTSDPGSTDNTGVTDPLPADLTFDGYDFRVLTHAEGNVGVYAQYFDPTDGSDTVSSAALNRNIAAEERLGITITCIEHNNQAGVVTLLYNAAMNNDDLYDVVDVHVCESVQNLLVSGALYDFASMEYLNLSQPYYVQQFNELFNVHGTQYLMSGDFNNSASMPLLVWFNKDIMDELMLDYPYDIVRNGDWTLDKMMEYAAKAYADIDGENGKTAGDRFGVSDLSQSWAYMLAGFDISPIVKNEEDGLELNLTSEKIVDVLSKINDLYHDSEFVNPAGNGWQFLGGRAMFSVFLSSFTAMRDIEDFTHGALPMPKWDDNQADYRTYSAARYLVAPACLPDPDTTGGILEYLNYLSYVELRPAVTSDLIEQKILVGEEDVEMYYITINNQFIDFGRYLPFHADLKTFAYMAKLINANSDDIAGWTGANLDAISTAFDLLYEYLGV